MHNHIRSNKLLVENTVFAGMISIVLFYQNFTSHMSTRDENCAKEIIRSNN